MPPRQSQDVDEVFRSRPSDFVRARDFAVRCLQKAGRYQEAAEIERLRKPSPALWAVNQLAHEHPGELAPSSPRSISFGRPSSAEAAARAALGHRERDRAAARARRSSGGAHECFIVNRDLKEAVEQHADIIYAECTRTERLRLALPDLEGLD